MNERVALFDIDGTLVSGFIAADFIEGLEHEKLLTPGTNQKVQDSIFEYRQTGEYEIFAHKLLIDWVEGLRGQSSPNVRRIVEQVAQEQRHRFFPYVGKTIELLQRNYDVCLVTAEPDFAAIAIGQELGVSSYISSTFELDGDIYTGRPLNLLASSKQKRESLAELLLKYDSQKSIAFGDSDGDIDMLLAVGGKFCINPKDQLKKLADNNGWNINAQNPDEYLLIRDRLP